jgi:hypothetical protein
MKFLQILVLVGSFVVVGYGQRSFENTFTTKLNGIVFDSEKPVKDAVVFAVDKRGNRYSITTDEKGRYEIRLPIGEYQIKAFVPTGFSVEISSDVNNFVVKKAKKTKLNFILFNRGCG